MNSKCQSPTGFDNLGARSAYSTGLFSMLITRAASFDNLVGKRDERGRDGKPEHSRRSRVDNELDLGGLCHRQVARRIALENARRAQSHATIGIAEISSHQPA